jgi:imidazolonepropionase-like amidohydrolase
LFGSGTSDHVIAAQSRPILIRADSIYTVTSGVIRDGEILIRDGKIQEVGVGIPFPARAEEYIADYVIPGMVDAHAHLALDRSGRNRISGPVTSEWKAVENLDLNDPMIQVALSGGITSLVTRPGSGVISSGQSVALKMKSVPGDESMILKPYVDLKMAVRPLIGIRPGETPQTVMGWYATADEQYRRASEYIEMWDAYRSGGIDQPPQVDERLEALAAVIRGDVMAHVHSHYPSEIMMVMRLARKYGFIDRLALGHAEEVFPLVDLLAGTKIVPVVGPMMIVQYYGDPEPHHIIKELMEAGVPASVQTDMSRQHFKDFREYGAFLARHGLKEEHALEALTINGAKAMMLEDRIGSIEPGKDADLVLLDGHFFDLTADRIESVFVDGVLEYERQEVVQRDQPRSVGPFQAIDNEVGPNDRTYAITNAHVFTVTDGDISGATVVIEDGKFARLDSGGIVPAGMPVMDVGGRVIHPGYVLARAYPNDWIGDLKWQVQNDEIIEPVVPEMNAVFAVDPWFPSYKVNMDMGVTAINVTPGRANLVGGNGVVIKTVGMDIEKMVRREPSSMVFSLVSDSVRTWSPDPQTTGTLETASAMVRGALDDARRYMAARGTEGPIQGDYNQRLEALIPVLQRRVPAVFHANRVEEIREAISIAADFELRLIVSGGSQAWQIADELVVTTEGVILGDSGVYSSEIRGGGEGWNVQGPAILSRAGVKVAFFGPGASRRAMPNGRLSGEPVLNSAWAFRNGVPEVEALKMATLNAAEMFDIADQIGSIEIGKVADFIVLEGHPFDYRVLPTMVFIDGLMVYRAPGS